MKYEHSAKNSDSGKTVMGISVKKARKDKLLLSLILSMLGCSGVLLLMPLSLPRGIRRRILIPPLVYVLTQWLSSFLSSIVLKAFESSWNLSQILGISLMYMSVSSKNSMFRFLYPLLNVICWLPLSWNFSFHKHFYVLFTNLSTVKTSIEFHSMEPN